VPIPRKKTFIARASSVLGIAVGVAGIAFVVRTLVDKWDEVSEIREKNWEILTGLFE
jgi:hypothetical protein